MVFEGTLVFALAFVFDWTRVGSCCPDSTFHPTDWVVMVDVCLVRLCVDGRVSVFVYLWIRKGTSCLGCVCGNFLP